MSPLIVRMLSAILMLLMILSPASPSRAQGSREPIKIGLVAAISGPGGFIGDPFNKAAKLAIDRANRAGGINGRRIELISYDSQGSPDQSLVFTKKLISDDKVSVILGPDFSSNVKAVLPTIDAAKVPLLYNTPVIDPAPHSYEFTPWPTEETSYRVAFTALKSLGVKKLAALATTDVTGESGMKWLKQLAPANGITLVAEEHFDPKDTDVTPQLTTLKGSGADAIFAIESGAVVAVVCKGYTQLGLKAPLAISTGAVSATFPDLLRGITPETLIFPTYKMLLVDSLPANDPNRTPIREFAKLYLDATGKQADFFAGAGWDLANIAIAAMKRAGSDPTAIRDAIEQVKNYPGTISMMTFTADNHRGAGPTAQVMGRFTDGKFIVFKR
jgi:branched-chain amino acid transport system substrate-binding protein